MITYLLSQFFAAVALALGVSAYLQNEDKRLKLFIGVSAVCMATHFALLQAWVGMALSLVGAVRYLIGSNSKNIWLLGFFIVLGTELGIWRYHDLRDILPIMANVILCLAIFKMSGLRMRGWMLAGTACWWFYNALHYSVVGTGLESFYLVTNGMKMLRLHKRSASN